MFEQQKTVRSLKAKESRGQTESLLSRLSLSRRPEQWACMRKKPLLEIRKVAGREYFFCGWRNPRVQQPAKGIALCWWTTTKGEISLLSCISLRPEMQHFDKLIPFYHRRNANKNVMSCFVINIQINRVAFLLFAPRVKTVTFVTMPRSSWTCEWIIWVHRSAAPPPLKCK